MKCPEEKWIH